ncbi:MAG: type IV pilus modification protein PilV, partial [Pseudomonadales bacterium]|nr:type IV pilus modification protein PilV [Pseudomonadales bacterium]
MKLSGFGDRGVSLIEVLVAMLILGVGVMGYAAVQLNAVKVTEHSNSRSQAMAIAQDAIERLRANVTNVDDYLGGDAWSNVAAWKNCASDN